jgi:phosphate transport system protein
MTRTLFTRDLQRLQDEVLLLGSMVRQALQDAVEALRTRDHVAARRIIAYDREINKRRFGIEESVLSLIALQNPMARDLRLLAGVLEIAGELERMGDYAKGISKINLYLENQPLLLSLAEISVMCEKALAMLQSALDAFISQDLEAARAIPARDDEIDELYNRVNLKLIALIIENPAVIDHANYLSWVAHNLERAADRVTNICERIVYTITGEFMEFDAEEPLLSGMN